MGQKNNVHISQVSLFQALHERSVFGETLEGSPRIFLEKGSNLRVYLVEVSDDVADVWSEFVAVLLGPFLLQ